MKDKISKLKNLVKKIWVGRNDKKRRQDIFILIIL